FRPRAGHLELGRGSSLVGSPRDRGGLRTRVPRMLPPILSFSTDPADLSPEERARAVAAILAAGLLRLRTPIISQESPSILPSENSRKRLANELALAPDKSVTVHAG